MKHQQESCRRRLRTRSHRQLLTESIHERKLWLEQLEDRRLLAVFTVDNLHDEPVAAAGDAPGTLRQAIFDANAQLGNDEILFADGLSGTILLSEGQLEITESAMITGPGAVQLTLEAFDPTPEDDNGDGNRIFRIDDGTTTAQDVSISGLTLTGGDVSIGGGAIFSLENLTIARSYITGNSASSTSGFLVAGGGIYINNANLVVEESTISDNRAYHDNGAVGGGIGSGSGNVTITNSTITGNEARAPFGVSGGVGYGGGVAVGMGTHLLAHTTISRNRAAGMDSFGGGIFAFGDQHSTTIDHTIVADNIAESGRDISTIGAVTARFSMVESTAGWTIDDDGGNLLDVDPNLGNELINFGGPTPTIPLMPGSPAIDGGDPLAQAGMDAVPEFDQRGAPFARVADGDGDVTTVVDIGAYEFQSVAGLNLIVDTSIDEFDGDFSAGDLSLREAIGLANGSAGLDTITFADHLSSEAIVLTRGELRIVDDLSIDAQSSAGMVLIDATGNDPTPNIKQGDGSRIFRVEMDDDFPDNIDVSLLGLHLTGGDVDGDGGAIDSRENLLLVDVSVEGNYATGFGGGVDQGDSNTTLQVTRSTVSGNIAAEGAGNIIPVGYSTRGGGGIRITGADAEIISSTISGNRTVGNLSDGGGIGAFGGNLTIRHSTIFGNSTSGDSARGGNISFRYGNDIVLDHTIVAGGRSSTDNDIHSPFDPIMANNSLIEDATGLTINGVGNITAVDPHLGPLADNGGRTRTHALLPNSIAIDGGAITFAGPPDFDQRDDPFIRVANGNNDAFTIVDIGAYERQSVVGLSLVVDVDEDENDGDYSAGDLSLREAIGLANGSIGNDVITFSPSMLGKTVKLTLGELQIVDDLVIDATSLGGRLTIDASGNDPTANAPPTGDGSRVITIDDGDTANFINVELIGLTLTGGDVLGNGGAIENSESLTFTKGSIFNNSALTLAPNGAGIVGAGGAIQVQGGGSLVLNNSTVYKNFSDVGGGIAVSQGELTLNSSTVSGNVVTSNGGGLWTAGANTAVTANHSTIAANRADEGGGIMMATSGGTITLNHTLVADNAADVTSDDVSSVDPVVFDHGWVENGTGFTPTGGLQFIGVDPELTPLGDHGGANLTHALRAGSPAVDAGDLFFAPPPTNDQRGAPFARVFDGNGDTTPRIDIGAYERQTLPGLNLLVDISTDEVNGNFGAGDLSLREAVSLANGSVGADSITFAPGLSGGTITLAQGQISITDDLTIDAMPLAENVIVDASGSDPTPELDNGDGSRLLSISNNEPTNVISVMIGGLALTGGDVDGDGGAIFSLENLQIKESTIRDNAASEGIGGAISAGIGDLSVASSTVNGNLAASGGGIGLRGASLTLVNSTVSNNEASVRGGGISGASPAVIEVRHSTISGNFASSSRQGGGIYAPANVNLTVNHTILANNQAGSGPDVAAVETVSLAYSLVEDATGFTSTGSPNIIGQNPKLGPLADNGGPTQTQALLDGSAAIDAGEFGIAIPLEYDQRGAPFKRIVAKLGSFEVIDIGAFEAQLIVESADFDSDGDVDGGDFLAWQRGFGKPAATKSDGDADNDNDVDQTDLEIWQNQHLMQAAEIPMQSAGAASVPREQLLDAALALEWLRKDTGSVDTVEVISEQAVVEAMSSDGEGFGGLTISTTVSEPVNDWPASADEGEDPTETWLTDDLLAEVFG